MKNRSCPHRPRRMRGFSLLEISVSLVVLGLLGFALWKIVPALDRAGETNPPEAQLALADEALIGFILAHSRLPCPDTDNDGDENCAVTAVTGALPWRTLGLRPATPLNYGVHRGTNALTEATAAHTPWLPPVATGTMTWPLSGDTSYDPANSYKPEPPPTDCATDEDGTETCPDYGNLNPNPDLGQMSTLPLNLLPLHHPTQSELDTVAAAFNGLDFCAKLRAIAGAPENIVLSNTIPVAYALAHPGKLDADGDGNAFDGGNATASFGAPHQNATDTYDDQVRAAGFNELAARLSCPAYLSRANAAGHTAIAAYDNYLFTLAYLQYRAFALDGAYGDLQQAYAGVTMGAVNVAGAILAGVMSVSAGVMTVDEAVGAVLIAAGAVITTVSVVEGIVELGYSIAGAVEAVEGVKEAVAARIEAEAQARKIRDVADATAQRALAIDAKGLRP